MTHRPTYVTAYRRSIVNDAKTLHRRGLTWQQVADTLGLNLRTLYRYLEDQ